MRLAFAPLHNSWATNHHFQKHRTLDIMGSKHLAAAFSRWLFLHGEKGTNECKTIGLNTERLA